MARVAPVKTAAQAAAKYGANGSSGSAATEWASGYTADIPGILDAAARSVSYWQSQVSTALAASNFTTGLGRAKNNVAAIAAKVNGVGKASFSAGIRAASQGAYLAFSQLWQGAVASEVATLDRTNPRGDRAANRMRQAVYDAWVDTQEGKFRVK